MDDIEEAPVPVADPDPQPQQAQAPVPAAAPVSAPPSSPYQTMAVKNGSVDESVLEGQPQRVQDLVRAYANYQEKLPQGMAMSKPPFSQALALVPQYDKTWSQAQYDARADFLKKWESLAPGTSGAQITSGRKLIDHLGEYSDKANSLNNKLPTPLNYLIENAQQNNLLPGGGSKLTTLETTLHDLALEKERFYQGGSPHVSGVAGATAPFNQYRPVDEQQAAVKEELRMMGGQLGPLRDKYLETMGKNAPPILLDQQRKVLTRLGVDPDAVERGEFDPEAGKGVLGKLMIDGKPHTFPDQKSADAAKAELTAAGHKVQ